MNIQKWKQAERKPKNFGHIKFVQSHSTQYEEEDEIGIKKSSNDIDDSFHFSIRPIATFVQFLFLMPVCGITNNDSDKLEFRILTFRVMITLGYVSYGVFVTGLYFKVIYQAGINAINFGKNDPKKFCLVGSYCD